ncbi:hypothetical protein [Tuberibacillus sp. Marseille-P3662]|uniref:hypothetical protein n=1 Tax=Tuberibacillus sp. Marseille-P3662 TaxID=1965358 RepID=UPI000A1C95EA|nr:hypothetical protein [Tuberibacillus sp. Marseille-P3662]
MDYIIPVKGAVNYSITLDASVWIFDDRKIAFEDFFSHDYKMLIDPEPNNAQNGLAPEQDAAGAPFQKNERRYKKSEWFDHSFVIPVKTFLGNAEPLDSANTVRFELDNQTSESVTLDEANKGVFLFSQDGQSIKERGPIHFYHGNGDNKDNPIKGIRKIVVE